MKKTSPISCRSGLAAALALVALAAGGGCGGPADVEVRVHSVGIDPATRSPVVLLEDRRRGIALPIWIGSAEAHAIAMEAEGFAAPRPMTHDLMHEALAGAGVMVEKVVIEALRDETYFARVHLRSLRRNFDLDARPSDAIALALRFGCPIYARAALLEGATVVSMREAPPAHRLTTAGGLTVQALDADLAEIFGVPPERGGLVVTDVAPALRGTVRRGDVILGVDGTAVRTAAELVERLRAAGRDGPVLQLRRGERDLRVALPPPG